MAHFIMADGLLVPSRKTPRNTPYSAWWSAPNIGIAPENAIGAIAKIPRVYEGLCVHVVFFYPRSFAEYWLFNGEWRTERREEYSWGVFVEDNLDIIAELNCLVDNYAEIGMV